MEQKREKPKDKEQKIIVTLFGSDKIGIVAKLTQKLAELNVNALRINMYDVVIHDKKKLEDNFDMPILGVIPRFNTDEGKNEK